MLLDIKDIFVSIGELIFDFLLGSGNALKLIRDEVRALEVLQCQKRLTTRVDRVARFDGLQVLNRLTVGNVFDGHDRRGRSGEW